MSNTSKFEEMLERLVNEDREGAEELFHEIVVEKSRDIYEALLSESDDEEVEETTDDEVDEATDEEVDESEEDLDEATDEEVDESDEELDEFQMEPVAMESDPTDDMMGDLEMPAMGGEEGEESEGGAEAALDDLEAALDALKAEFASMMGSEEEGEEEVDMDMGGEEEPEEEAFQYEAADEEVEEADKEEKSAAEQMREYVEKIGGDQYKDFGKMGDNGANTKSTVASKNDMGGTTANMTKGGTTSTGEVGKGKMQGSALNDQNPKEDNAGNINVPGGKAGNAMSANGKGHGAEKKGAGETADNKKSVVGK
jgi:hypothetical protein